MAEKLNGIDGETSRNLASALIGRWLAVDPGTVLTSMPGLLELVSKNFGTRGDILDALAAKRPGEMLALVPSQKDANGRYQIISRALRELAAHDPPQARAWLNACTDPEDRRAAEKALRLGTVQADPLRAIELAGSVEDRSEGNSLLRSAAESAAKMGAGMLRQLATAPMKPWMLAPLLRELAERDPELAVDLAVQSAVGGNDAGRGLSSAFSALARRDPAQAIGKREGLAGSARAAAIVSIGTEWAAREPAAALAWLAERPKAERTDPQNYVAGSNDALQMAFANWADRAQGEAQAWADALPAGATRDAVQMQFARALADRGAPAEAMQLLTRLGLDTDLNAIWGVTGAWAKSDPLAAADWAVAQPPGKAQNQALRSIIVRWANDDPRGVADWLAQFPPGEARNGAVGAFLMRMGAWVAGRAERDAEFDAWLPLIDDPWQRAQLAANSFNWRKKRDPAGARAWFSALPNVDAELIRQSLRNDRN